MGHLGSEDSNDGDDDFKFGPKKAQRQIKLLEKISLKKRLCCLVLPQGYKMLIIFTHDNKKVSITAFW